MPKRTLRTILIVIIVAISLYQFFNNADPMASEPSMQPVEINTALIIAEGVVETEEVQIEPTVLPIETPTQAVYLEETSAYISRRGTP